MNDNPQCTFSTLGLNAQLEGRLRNNNDWPDLTAESTVISLLQKKMETMKQEGHFNLTTNTSPLSVPDFTRILIETVYRSFRPPVFSAKDFPKAKEVAFRPQIMGKKSIPPTKQPKVSTLKRQYARQFYDTIVDLIAQECSKASALVCTKCHNQSTYTNFLQIVRVVSIYFSNVPVHPAKGQRWKGREACLYGLAVETVHRQFFIIPLFNSMRSISLMGSDVRYEH